MGVFFESDRAVISLSRGLSRTSFALQFLGARPTVLPQGSRPTGARVSYLARADRNLRQGGLSAYEHIVYRDLWRGVDMVFRGGVGQLTYDFIVRPHARPSAIRLEYVGVKRIALRRDGGLDVTTALGSLRESPPLTYQNIDGRRIWVPSRFVVRGTSVRFAVGAYDRRYPLVIDPDLVYSTFAGGGWLDQADDVAVDLNGNAYVAGTSQSGDYPTTLGAIDRTWNGDSDAFISKLDPTGTRLIYSTYLGGAGADRALDVAVDGSGHVYVTGTTASVNFPTTPTAVQPAYGGGGDAFLAKLSESGEALVYSTYLGGSGADVVSGVGLDGTGAAYVAGDTSSADFPTTPGAFDRTYNGRDAFVAKLSLSGSTLVYSTFLGGTGEDRAYALAVADDGDVLVTGEAGMSSPPNSSLGIPPLSNFPITPGAFQTTFDGGIYRGGTTDAFVSRIDADGGSLVFSTFLGGSGGEEGRGVAINSGGDVYVTGRAGSSIDFPVTPDAFDPTFNGSGDAFVTKLDATGAAALYSSYLGGDRYDETLSIAVDAAGQAWVIGTTASAGFPTSPDALDGSFNGGIFGDSTSGDAFVTAVAPSGDSLAYSTFLGGAHIDGGNGITVGRDGDVFAVGLTYGAGFPTTAGSVQPVLRGVMDGFVVRLRTRPLDQVAPATTDDGPSGWVNDDVLVHLAATDAASGVAATYFAVDGGPFQEGTVVALAAPADHTNDGMHVIRYYSVDLAGNVEAEQSAIVRIDTVAPAIDLLLSPQLNAAGWSSIPVTVSFVCGDTLSGVDSCPAAVVVDSEGAAQVISGTVSDRAGNTAHAATVVGLDLTDPIVTDVVFAPNPLPVLTSGILTATASDAPSGVVGAEFFVGSDPGAGAGMPMAIEGDRASALVAGFPAAGVYEVGVRAQDAAGRWGPVSTTFVVAYDPAAGFATGAGSIVPGSASSDPGDQLPSLDGSSRAQFAFNVKYQSGANTVPGGGLQFRYQAGGLRLQSTGMEWLAVTNSNWARFQGLATIEGMDGAYRFRVDARDGDDGGGGQADRFIIRIWTPGVDPDATEQLYKASGDVSGQIVIHR